MKKRSFILAVALLLCLCACAVGQGSDANESLLWFVLRWDDGHPELCSAEYAGDCSAPQMMETLLAGPAAGTGLVSLIPEGTKLLDCEQRGDLVHVDLSEPYAALTGAELTLADYCITLTLTQLEGVDSVYITVNGRELPQRSKQVFRADDVVLSGAEEEPVELTAALCFRRTGGDELGEELRIFRLTESQSATLAVLQALLAGPSEPGLQALLPEGLEVYSARVETGICYVDFSDLLLAEIPERVEEQQLVLRSIVESLQSLGYVQAVQLLVEGEPLSQYGQVDVSQPIG